MSPTFGGDRHYDNLQTRLGKLLARTPFERIEAHLRAQGPMSLAKLMKSFPPVITD